MLHEAADDLRRAGEARSVSLVVPAVRTALVLAAHRIDHRGRDGPPDDEGGLDVQRVAPGAVLEMLADGRAFDPGEPSRAPEDRARRHGSHRERRSLRRIHRAPADDDLVDAVVAEREDERADPDLIAR